MLQQRKMLFLMLFLMFISLLEMNAQIVPLFTFLDSQSTDYTEEESATLENWASNPLNQQIFLVEVNNIDDSKYSIDISSWAQLRSVSKLVVKRSFSLIGLGVHRITCIFCQRSNLNMPPAVSFP